MVGSTGTASHNYRHGHAVNGRRSPTNRSWNCMMQRCYNPNADQFSYYGGRGIRVCERWHSFINFLADMGERPVELTLERKDNDGNYEPANCCWATRSEQCKNQRRWKKYCPAFGGEEKE